MAERTRRRVPPFDFHKHREEYPAAGEVTTRVSVTAFYRNVVVAYTRPLKVSESAAPSKSGPAPSDMEQSGLLPMCGHPKCRVASHWPESSP